MQRLWSITKMLSPKAPAVGEEAGLRVGPAGSTDVVDERDLRLVDEGGG